MKVYIYRTVILGGGVAAGYAAQEFVRQGTGELAIISADAFPPYERPPLSKTYLAGDKTMTDILINPPTFYTRNKIALFLNTLVTGVDLRNRRLYTEAGDMIQFDQLLITTGSRARQLAIPNAHMPGIYTLRTLSDSSRIRDAAAEARQAVVIGGGYIGMEAASALAQSGVPVTMVFPGDRLMERFFTPEMSDFFQSYYAARGVRFVTGALPAAFQGEDVVTGVVLDDERELPADIVVAGVGAVPNIDLFRDTDLHLNDGIVVNKYLETNWEGIYAAGDVADYYDVIFQKRRRIEHWDNAVQQGRHAAAVMMAGKNRSPFMNLRYFFSDVFDLSYEFWGDTDAADTVVYRGSVASGSFSAWWLTGGRIDAAFVMNRPEEERELAPKWILRRRYMDADALADESQPLGRLAPQLVF